MVLKRSDKLKKQKIRYFLFCLFSLIFAILIFHLNRLTLFTSDDFTYHYVYQGYLPTSHPKRIHGILSIIEFQINHWKMWNGRFVAHTMVQFILQFKKIYFDIINTLIYLILIWLIILIGKTKEVGKIRPAVYILSFIYFWFYLPEIGKSVLWISGSCNYLWTSVIYLTYFLCIISITNKEVPLFKGFEIVLLGFLAGASNENSSPATLLMAFIYLAIHYPYRSKGTKYGIASLFTGGLGFLLMLKSPGSQKRGAMTLTIDIVKDNFKMIFDNLIHNYWFIYTLIILFIILLVVKKVKLSKNTIALWTILFVGHFSSAFALIASPETPKRTLFGSVLFLGIILFSLINVLYREFNQKGLAVFVALLSFLFLHSYWIVNEDLTNSFKEVSNQYSRLYNSPKNSDVRIPLLSTPKTDYNAYLLTSNVKIDSNDWFNQWMSVYFDKKSITGY